MGILSVEEVLSDPDFVDEMVLIHRKTTVNSFGENVLSECGLPTYGVIQPASGKTIQRLPDALRVANLKSFWVRGKIVADGNGQYTDILVHKGIRYQVQNIFDWANWGEGWSEGTCVQEKIAR